MLTLIEYIIMLFTQNRANQAHIKKLEIQTNKPFASFNRYNRP